MPLLAPALTDPRPDTRSDASRRFVHLHLHSQYSLLDGGNRLDRLVRHVKQLGMDAVAVTDHGNLHGAVEFYNLAKKEGIKPILGIEAYVAPDVNGKPSDRTNREYTGVSDGGFHLVLLAENATGWANLLKLSSDAYLNGFYFKPRMDKSTLEKWSDGLIAINGHLGSSLAYHLVKYHQTKDPTHWKHAVAEAQWHASVFRPNGDGEPRFFLEMQHHGEQLQRDLNPHMARLADELNLPLVCDNDAHFMTADDWDAHDSLCCISMGKVKSDATRMHYARDLYVKSPRRDVGPLRRAPRRGAGQHRAHRGPVQRGPGLRGEPRAGGEGQAEGSGILEQGSGIRDRGSGKAVRPDPRSPIPEPCRGLHRMVQRILCPVRVAAI